jgi:hypothetical protein
MRVFASGREKMDPLALATPVDDADADGLIVG